MILLKKVQNGNMLYNFDELLFQILTIDRFFHKEGNFSVKARPYAALSFRESGTGTFRIGNKSFNTKPGDVLFIPADTPYEVEYSTSESIVVNMGFCNYLEAEIFEFESKSSISAMFSLLLGEWQKRHSVNRAKATIYNILERIHEFNSIKIDNPALAECIQYMELHFCDPELDIKSVCDVGFVSKSTLYRFFITHFGISPNQYLIKLRMNKALQLLVEDELSVKEIAFVCGFLDDKYFSRLFKNKYGCPPSQLRKHIHM